MNNNINKLLKINLRYKIFNTSSIKIMMVATYKNINFSEKEDLIKKNTLLVKKIAWHYHGRVKNIVEIDDLIQIGMLGLITAANNFTERPGVNFSSYAKIRIKGEIVDFLRKNSNLCRTTITNKQKYERIT